MMKHKSALRRGSHNPGDTNSIDDQVPHFYVYDMDCCDFEDDESEENMSPTSNILLSNTGIVVTTISCKDEDNQDVDENYNLTKFR